MLKIRKPLLENLRKKYWGGLIYDLNDQRIGKTCNTVN